MPRVLRMLLLTVVALVAIGTAWFFLPTRIFYRERRPTRVGRLTNRAAAWLGAHAPSPDWNIALEVPGRRTGRPHTTALVLADVDGERYAVSMLGERSEWLRNVRANGLEAVILHRGRRTPVYFEEVPVQQRAAIIRAYAQRAPGGRRHIPVDVNAPVEEFEQVAGDYPVLRVCVPVTSAAARG